MAQDMIELFSSVLTGDDSNIVPLTESMLSGKDSAYLGKLIVRPNMVIEQIGRIKETKSLDVDGIPTKFSIEIWGCCSRRMEINQHHTLI